MRAILLAAGLGVRLRPITNKIPKCLVPILGRPLIDYWLDLLLGQGIERVLVNTHYFASQVISHLAENPWAERIDTVYEEKLLGTGGSIVANSEFFESGSFLVAHADNLTRFDVRKFYECHQSRPPGNHITMMTFRTDDPESCGIVEVDSEGIVRAFHEKAKNPVGNLANGAIYIFDRTVLSFMRALDRAVIDISTEVLPHFIGQMNTFHNDDYLRDIGTPGMLKRAERDLLNLGHF